MGRPSQEVEPDGASWSGLHIGQIKQESAKPHISGLALSLSELCSSVWDYCSHSITISANRRAQVIKRKTAHDSAVSSNTSFYGICALADTFSYIQQIAVCILGTKLQCHEQISKFLTLIKSLNFCILNA